MSTGLDRHDAVYCGEWQLTAPNETIYLIKGGKVVWQHAIPNSDELGDCTMTSYGSVFFNRKSYGAQEIMPNMATGNGGTIVWEYKQEGGTEVHAPMGGTSRGPMNASVPIDMAMRTWRIIGRADLRSLLKGDRTLHVRRRPLSPTCMEAQVHADGN